MTRGRIAALLLGAAVCGAWLASAAGVTRQARTARTAPRAPDAAQFDALALDMQAQAGKLRDRLAQAPAPRDTSRNPFRFADRHVRSAPAPRREAAVAEPIVVPEAPRDPALQLIGIAETKTEAGLVRTAMITGGHDELMMVTPGGKVLSRYEVVAVGADAVELKDLQTGAVRRLYLQQPPPPLQS